MAGELSSTPADEAVLPRQSPPVSRPPRADRARAASRAPFGTVSGLDDPPAHAQPDHHRMRLSTLPRPITRAHDHGGAPGAAPARESDRS